MSSTSQRIKVVKKSRPPGVKAKAPAVGEIHKKNTLFLSVHVGSITDGDDGPELFKLRVTAAGFVPIVVSSKTGKTFTLPWLDIVALAKKAGVDR